MLYGNVCVCVGGGMRGRREGKVKEESGRGKTGSKGEKEKKRCFYFWGFELRGQAGFLILWVEVGVGIRAPVENGGN